VIDHHIAHYIAAALISHAEIFDGRVFKGDVENLPQFANDACDFAVSAELAFQALEILKECGLASVTRDEFAGEFMRIGAAGFGSFVENGRRQINEAQHRADVQGVDIEDAFHDKDRSGISLYNFKALDRYFEYGDDWLHKALTSIHRQLSGDVPASDRVVPIDHNSPSAAEITSSFEALEASLKGDNDTGALIDDQRLAALEEVSRLKQWWLSTRVRCASFLTSANATLSWVGEKAAAATVGDLAKNLLKLLLDFFS
jgi:hypothetical protein